MLHVFTKFKKKEDYKRKKINKIILLNKYNRKKHKKSKPQSILLFTNYENFEFFCLINNLNQVPGESLLKKKYSCCLLY